MITVKVEGMQALQASLSKQANQIPFAAARALTVTAHAVHAEIKRQLTAGVQGGATPYTLRAFSVKAATKATLTAEVGLRTGGPPGGTPYDQAIAHLFHGGTRRFKRLEAWLKARGLMPASMQIAPGSGIQLDQRGNMYAYQRKEMTKALTSRQKNFQIFRQSGAGKETKSIGFFVVLPGSVAAKHLPLGIYRRIYTKSSKSSAIEHWFSFSSPGTYQRQYDLDSIGSRVVSSVWPANFETSLAKALATAR
jgi:hypothetical protein